uniref:Small ribosomal subunit protein mS31 n=1 Tax=Daphnia hispanica TaxID=575233 RepID=A0A4Y7M1Y8_9CRUS|nr:EOG090X04UC [Daphnia hispanica]
MLRLSKINGDFHTKHKNVIAASFWVIGIGSVKRNEVLARNLCFTTKLNSNKEQDESKNVVNSKNKAEMKEAKQKEAKAKLNMLLESMSKTTQKAYPVESKLSLATPKIKTKLSKPDKRPAFNPKIEPEMLQAVEDVSNTLSHEKEAFKNSLIEKLEAVADESEMARLEPFRPNKKKTEDLNSLLNTLKVDAKKPKNKLSAPKLAPVKVEDIYSAQPSGIFGKAHFLEESTAVSGLATWDMLYEKELELAVTHPPANGFQQMIQWTKQGKVWRFPIDNEQGLEEEAQVGFHEHVFLEPHLKPWCPRRGPVRHFMELVIVGLSKNPYLTVEQKKEHINWFRDFFNDKRSILIDTGAIPDVTTKSTPSLST